MRHGTKGAAMPGTLNRRDALKLGAALVAGMAAIMSLVLFLAYSLIAQGSDSIANTAANPPAAISVTYIANEGFLVENGGKKVLIDALFDSGYLHIPVVDRTGLVGRFDVDLTWDDEKKWDDSGRYYFTNPEGLKQAVLDQLGLELVPSREPTEMLVVEKAK